MKTRFATLLALLAAVPVVAACGSGSGSNGGGGKLNLVAYSTPKEAYAALIPAFNKTPGGKGVSFTQSFGPSGDQARAVVSGLPADVVALSLAPDVNKLVDAKKVAAGWDKNSANGFVTNSVVVFAVRKGNPKNIKTWDDLVKPGVQVIEANPFASGGARWNVMAAYGAQLEQGKSDAEAQAYLSKLFHNVPVQDKSARDSLTTFTNGKGDVLLAYENEAIAAKQAGQDIDYVVPDQTILIQNPIAVTSTSKNPAKAKAFIAFLRSKAGQEIFQSKGYRPIDDSLLDKTKFPTPSNLFKIDKLGGWSAVNDKFFDPDKGVVAKIEKSLGVSTSK
ncbi:MAG: sulfate/thiosulfate transport system substrate-binding protein [Thermoleophilaceae bacterium]|jgi:sulfate transport system substrate-binding protein|nr:sulfate/thiosulfate transport system substrate-binding protein [Thermoleophilaceae bacterium]